MQHVDMQVHSVYSCMPAQPTICVLLGLTTPALAPARPAGASDVDELLDALAAGQEANFSLFNYVNDLSGEVDKLEEGIATLRWAGVWGGGGAGRGARRQGAG